MTSRKTMASQKDTSVPLLPGSGDDFGKFKPLTVHICTSAQEFNVKGLIDEIRSRFPSHSDLVGRVEYVELPYNDIDNYTFEKKDAVVLCHSIHNRRFAITDVMDALYNDFLKNALATPGLRMVGVIAHDFPEDRLCTDAKYEMNMEAFKCRQPTAFKYADLIMMTGRLEVGQVELSEERWKELEAALKAAKRKPVPLLPIPRWTLWLLALILCLSLILLLRKDYFSDENWLDVVWIGLFGGSLVLVAFMLNFIKELKKFAIQTSLFFFCVEATLVFLNVAYVSIAPVALPPLLAGINGQVVYKYCQRNGLTKLMKARLVKCAAVVVVAYGFLVVGYFL